MVSKSVIVSNNTGLHARPASDFVKLATSQACDVYIEKDGKTVTAKSILGVLSLAVTQGSTIKIFTEGSNELEALDKLVEFVGNLED